MKCTIDKEKAAAFPHFWEECIGSCHAALALREDWRDQMAQCGKELGFRSVRFHGILNDDMSVFLKRGDRTVYSFHNVDLISDFLLGIGMKPFVELGYMPRDLASGSKTVFHYRGNITPPADFSAWETLIEKLVRHLVSRYGEKEIRQWRFEVWNEPNLRYFWAGSREKYFSLYRHAAQAIKRVDPQIPVGGPATARNAWVAEMIRFCESTGTPLDFISTHHYPTDSAVDQGADMESRMAAAKRGVLGDMAVKTRGEAGRYPLYYTEWSSSPSSRDPYHDMPYAAAFIMQSIKDAAGLVDMYSYWTFSDIFEEEGFPSGPFHGGFGLLNLHGVPKPAYRAFQLLHSLGRERLSVNWEGERPATLDALAARTRDNLTVIVFNHNVPKAHIVEETLTIAVPGRGMRGAYVERIDEYHANPRRRWVELGSPEYPDQSAIADLMEHSRLVREPARVKKTSSGFQIDVAVPPHGVAAITLES